ncbi:MAG: hypothetical protein U1C97_03400, partial [Candidatus Gracilibacteria bacterium]|nr:hypothetical protein [Candidatus Gracilibacteria bacterium]
QDDTWHRGVDVKSFNGQFLYLLDPPSNTIWKYSRLRSGYSGATAWTSDGDLSDAVSFAIDGEVYVLMRNGTIARYLKGTLQPFEIKDAPTEPLNNPTRIFTHAEASHLYVLDSANQRVVIYSKGQGGIGSYQKQVLFESLKPNEIRDFYVDQDEQKLTILTSDKVYITDL